MAVNDEQIGNANTKLSSYGSVGALDGLFSQDIANQAMSISNQLYPQLPEPDPWEAAFQFFAEMGRQASQPGATVLGSAVGSMQAPLDYLNAKKKEKAESDRARMQSTITLGTTLKGKDPSLSAIAKLNADFKAGRITKEQFDAAFAKATNIADNGSGALSPLGKLSLDFKNGVITQEQFNAQFEKLTNISDGSETALEKLEAQAIAGGLEKGSDAYKEWILTGGKTPNGFTLESDGKGGFTFVQGDVKGQKSGRVEKGYIQKTLNNGTVVQQVVPGSLAFTEVETQRLSFEEDIAGSNFLLKTVDAIIGRPEGNGETGMLPNPNLDSILGSIQGNIPKFLNQDKQDLLVKIDFLKSNAFMEAFASLKGGGQITEKEGDAATAALAMLQRTQSPEEFTKGLTEFANIIRRGREKAKRLSSSLPQIAGTISGGEDVILNFEEMSNAQLRLIDVKSLTPKQRLDLAKKLELEM